MNILDKLLCGFLALGTIGHFFGTLKYTEFGSGLFVWSLSGVMACALLVALNWLRQARPADKPIAAIALAGNLGWVGIVLLFGHSIANLADPRVLMHGVTAFILAIFSIRSLRMA